MAHTRLGEQLETNRLLRHHHEQFAAQLLQ